MYPIGLRELLPCIWVPLREHEDEILLDLQHVFNRIYDTGPYRRARWTTPARCPRLLDKEDAAWAAELTRPCARPGRPRCQVRDEPRAEDSPGDTHG